MNRALATGLGLLAFACGCGGSWADADTKSVVDAVHAELEVESICGVEGGTCAPGQVRALERSALCSDLSLLFRHGQTLPDSGVTCLPP